MVKTFGYTMPDPDGAHLACVEVDGTHYRINPLGERTGFYSQRVAEQLAVGHAARIAANPRSVTNLVRL